MDKFRLKKEFEDSNIITRTEDGTEILITSSIFNDYYGELLIRNGMQHVVDINPRFEEDVNQKKTFQQVTENVILLTSNPEQIVKAGQQQTVEELGLKRKPGRPARQKE